MQSMTTPTESSEQKTDWKKALLELLIIAGTAAALVVPIRIFIAQPFIVSGASMFPTFENRDYLIIDEISYRLREPERGEVVVFKYPKNPKQFFIKRIIGLPGETVRIANSRVTITNEEHPDGFVLDESFLDEEVITLGDNIAVTLEAGEFFVMGDNRTRSSDSREWGALPEDMIIGRAWLRLFPFKHIDFLPGDQDTEPSPITHNN
jgi:signal peptidase I